MRNTVQEKKYFLVEKNFIVMISLQTFSWICIVIKKNKQVEKIKSQSRTILVKEPSLKEIYAFVCQLFVFLLSFIYGKECWGVKVHEL